MNMINLILIEVFFISVYIKAEHTVVIFKFNIVKMSSKLFFLVLVLFIASRSFCGSLAR